LNGFLCLNAAPEGKADLIGGQYVLTLHGRVLAQVSELEYHLHRAYEVRLFSGLWLIFYMAPSLYFVSTLNAETRPLDASPAPTKTC
jgi:hypothetical protein